MNAAFQSPTTERRRGLTIDRVGEGGFSNHVGTRMLDDGFVERLGTAPWQLSECPLLAG